MSKQLNAMQLADAYADASFEQGLHQRTIDPAPEIAREAFAAELRRLHEANAEMVAALKTYQRAGIGNSTDFLVQNIAYERGLLAIAKHGGQ